VADLARPGPQDFRWGLGVTRQTPPQSPLPIRVAPAKTAKLQPETRSWFTRDQAEDRQRRYADAQSRCAEQPSVFPHGDEHHHPDLRRKPDIRTSQAICLRQHHRLRLRRCPPMSADVRRPLAKEIGRWGFGVDCHEPGKSVDKSVVSVLMPRVA